MLLLGVLAGLLAALGQASSYLVSRHVLSVPGRGSVQLIVLSNVCMGVPAVCLLPLFWVSPVHPGAFTAGLIMNMFGYCGAQLAFFWTIRRVPASRVAPLLGVKIVLVALLAQLLGLAELAVWQWLAVALAVVAAVAVQYAGERLSARSLLGLLAVVSCFSIADTGLGVMLRGLGQERSFSVALLMLFCVYAALLPPSLCFLPRFRPVHRQPWLPAMVYAGVWTASMIALFTSITFAGLVLAIICQALRGPLSLPLGLLVARAGGQHLEHAVGERFWRQLFAALLMVGAIALYVASGSPG